MASDESKEVAVSSVEKQRLALQFHDYMLQRAEESKTTRGADVTESQMERILNATTEDEIWDADSQGTIQARDAIGLEVEILTLNVVASNRQDIESYGYYVSCEAICLGGPEEVLRSAGLEIGDEFVLQTGAPLIVTKLRAFEASNLLPVAGVISGTPTSNGRTVLRFRRVPKRATSASAS